MKQLKILFKDSQQALEFCDHARTSGLYLWDCDSLEREIILNYSKSLPQTLKNTKSWYYDLDAEAQFNRWIAWMTVSGYQFTIKNITGKKP